MLNLITYNIFNIHSVINIGENTLKFSRKCSNEAVPSSCFITYILIILTKKYLLLFANLDVYMNFRQHKQSCLRPLTMLCKGIK